MTRVDRATGVGEKGLRFSPVILIVIGAVAVGLGVWSLATGSKSGPGWGGIVVGALAIVLALAMKQAIARSMSRRAIHPTDGPAGEARRG